MQSWIMTQHLEKSITHYDNLKLLLFFSIRLKTIYFIIFNLFVYILLFYQL